MPEPLLKTYIELDGPFFRKDVRRTISANIREFMERVAAEGEAEARAQLRAGEGGRAPLRAFANGSRVSAHVIGRVQARGGKQWWRTAVISVNNSGLNPAQGISLMAGAASIERRVHVFRRLASRLRSSVRMLRANLTKGLE